MSEPLVRDMSLRDHFAISALNGLLAGHDKSPWWRHLFMNSFLLYIPGKVARWSYLYADAMLVERTKSANTFDPTEEES